MIDDTERPYKKEDISKYRKIKKKENLYYYISVIKDMVKADIKAKYYLRNSISNDIKLKDKLEGMKYSRDEEILLFISKLKMIYEELRDLKYKISEEEKYNFFNEIKRNFKRKTNKRREKEKIYLPEYRNKKEDGESSNLTIIKDHRRPCSKQN
ncbi:hypothetical protein H8356DRAFT_1421642 [Neocallimastix lanati (nom. inval.)]|nr:hypothetical protein H8356DRAFT_1421642 [Neocallimastix sp. JGI-2020a]